jgi:hypothetical protein
MVKKVVHRDLPGQEEIRGEVLELIRDAVSRGTSFTFKAHGSSMFPLIPGGTEVTVERIGEMPPAAGAIIVALRGGRLFCHRLVETRREPGGRLRFILKGDNHRQCDEPFGEDDIVGEVSRVRIGPLDLSSRQPLYRAAGTLWMRHPGPAILGMRIAWKLSWPARRALRSLLDLLDLARHGNEDD